MNSDFTELNKNIFKDHFFQIGYMAESFGAMEGTGFL